MIPYKVFEAFVIEKNREKMFSQPHRRHVISRRESLHRQACALHRPEHRAEIIEELHEYVQRYEEYLKTVAPAAVIFPGDLIRRELYLKCKSWGWRGKEKNADIVKMSFFLRSRGATQAAIPTPKIPQSQLVTYITNQYRDLYVQHYPPEAEADIFRFDPREYDLDCLDRSTRKQIFRDFVGHGRSRQFNVEFVRKTAVLSTSGVSFVPNLQLPEAC